MGSSLPRVVIKFNIVEFFIPSSCLENNKELITINGILMHLSK